MERDDLTSLDYRRRAMQKKSKELDEGPKDAAGKSIFVKKIAKSAGVSYKDAGAIAAAAGRKRMGKKKFDAKAAAGRRKAQASEEIVNELSNDKLNQYKAKATQDATNAARAADRGDPDAASRQDKRNRGLKRMMKKKIAQQANETTMMSGDNKKKSMYKIKKDMDKAVDKANAKLDESDTHTTKDGKKAKKGLWYYINKKRKEGRAKAKPGDKAYPSKDAFQRASEENMEESFGHYTVTHKPTGKKYKVTAMHKDSAVQKASRQHGGRTASAYSGTNDRDFHAEEIVMEKSAAEVLKKRYASDHPDDNPQATKRIKDHIPGMATYKSHPGAKHQPSTGTYSKKGKMAALKKQHARRPEQYGITKEAKMVPGFIGADGKATSKPTAKDYAANKEYQGMKKKLGNKIPGPKAEEYSKKEIRMGKGVAFDKRYKGGNYSGAYKTINKIKKGLADHPKVKDALKRANESVYTKNEVMDAFLTRVIERANAFEARDPIPQVKSFMEVAGTRGRPKKGTGTDSEGHIIMQLRSAQDLKGNKDIKFRRGSAKVHPKHIDKILKLHDHPSMKPIDKRKLRVAISKSHNHLQQLANKIK